MQTSEKPLFVSSFVPLTEPSSRLRCFCVGVLVQTLLLITLAKAPISLMAPVFQPVDVPDSTHWVAVELLPPPEPAKVEETPKPLPLVHPRPEARVPKQAPSRIELPTRRIEVAKVTPPALPVPDNLNSPELAPEPKHPRAATPNFSGSSAPATEKRPARQVQTGGFGDPNGVPVNPNSRNGPMIPMVGSFDLPQGAGKGNGQGGGKGVRGTVTSAGFGNGIATQGEGGPHGKNGQEKVRSTDFGSVYPAPVEPVRRQIPSTAARDTPVSVLNKPTPSYTLEARQRKIEGDVELEVEFTAQGQVHVLAVLQGLGYGLDEAAVRAVEQIRFAPARHDGRAVDSRGQLKVVFRLS